MAPDSARYAELTFRYLGNDPRIAHQLAVALWCDDQAAGARWWNSVQASPQPATVSEPDRDCVRANADHFIPTGSPRYQAIFDSRPGYPLAAAALAPLTGVRVALRAVPVLCVLAAGLGVWWLLRLLIVPPALAACGQALLYLLPTGTWGALPLTEGPVLAGVVAAMTGAVLLIHGRIPAGLSVLTIGLGWTALVKYSTGLALAGASVAAAALAARTDASRRGLLALGAIALTVLAVVLGLSRQLGLPGSYETTQDLFAHHFTQPDVPGVPARLVDANLRYWPHWIHLMPSNPLLLAATITGAWALWHWHRSAAVVVMLSGLIGVALTMAHPDPNATDRLYVLLWLPAVVGLPVAVWRFAVRNGTPARPAAILNRVPVRAVRPEAA